MEAKFGHLERRITKRLVSFEVIIFFSRTAGTPPF